MMSDSEVSRKRKCAVFEDKGPEEFEECSFTYILTDFMLKKTPELFSSPETSYHDCHDSRLPEAQWELDVYPSDYSDDENGVITVTDHVSVFVGLDCLEDTAVEGQYNFEILNSEGMVLRGKSDPDIVIMGRKNGESLGCWGEYTCFSHVDIEKDSLFDGHLTIRANIRYRIISGGVPAEKLTPSGVFLRSLQKQTNSARSADIILVSSDDREIPAHKFVLSMQSDVFAAMFEHPLREVTTGRCVIDDLDGETVEAMIKYMYGQNEWNPELAGKLVIAANKYRIEILEDACVKELITQMNVENVLDLFTLADCNNLNELKSKSMDFMGKNIQAFVAAGGLTRMYKTQSVQLMEQIEQVVRKQLADVKK